MRYQINHTLSYTYDRPVTLAPHRVRLLPRSDVTQAVRSYSLAVSPLPTQIGENLDLDGSSLLLLYFSDEPIEAFTITVASEVETFRSNPSAFLLEPWATYLPIDYPMSLLAQLQPYLGGQGLSFASVDPVAVQLAQEILHSTDSSVIAFLTALNQRICDACDYVIRETGEPFSPGMTWTKQSGSCRDFAVLFMEVCRAVGLAARFVSGYHEGDPDWTDRHLHAWVEVYLPGAGWRGYDPTQALAVGDRYIPLSASPYSRNAAPIAGALKTGIGAQAEMSYKLDITPLG